MLRPVEGSERRFAGYIRVSRVAGRTGPSYISPTVQEDSIRRWAEYQGVQIAAVYKDEDQSGGTQNRVGLRAAIERVERGEIHGIACWKLSRFARNVSGALADLERIRAAGGDVVFVEEQIDTSGPIGQFILTILLAVATLERDNLSAGFELAKQLAVARGALIGPTPYGYRRLEDGTVQVDEPAGEHVAQAYRLAAARGVHAAVEHLQRNAAGRTWTISTVRRTLASRVYLGEQRYGELVNDRAHVPLISRAVWEAAQTDAAPKASSAQYPLSGIAVCGSCRNVMIGARAGKRQRTYRCSATLATYRGERCERGAHILADTLERHVESHARPLLAGRRLRVGDIDADRGALLERQIVEAEAELDEFAGDLILRRALGARYSDHARARVQAIEAARAAYREWADSSRKATRVPGDDCGLLELAGWLRDMSIGVVVAPGRGNVGERVVFDVFDDDLGSGVAGLPEVE